MKQEVDIEHIFDEVLDEDEQVVKIIKPSKSRYWKFFLMPLLIPIFLPHFIVIMACTLFFIIPLLYARSYNNLFYTYTNKRLIIRSGTVGINYRSLYYDKISDSTVKVGILDKGKTKTGTLSFSGLKRSFDFSDVENPYDLMSEINGYINTLNAEN